MVIPPPHFPFEISSTKFMHISYGIHGCILNFLLYKKSRHFLFHFCSSPLYRTLTKPSTAVTSIFSLYPWSVRSLLLRRTTICLVRRHLVVEENNDLVVRYDFEKSESLYMVSSVPFLCDFLISLVSQFLPY
ncbi:hypothetical protein PRUPE_8G054900 [Prunus persica]|uniref:Uncharacterized protein n=1 Tax=Prunus persica TaxID=3760 RepID=A0A251MVZ0_PRUPE|nr:hypothetical protein PRUPE_8G054900 [Prunus persica]